MVHASPAKCGQGYYESDKPNFCPNCGSRIAAPVPSLAIKHAREGVGIRRRSMPCAGGGVSGGMASTACSRLKTFFKLLVWIVGIAIACWIGYYAVIWIWAVMEFIVRHWIISFIVLCLVIGAASKS